MDLSPLDDHFQPFPKIPRLTRQCVITEKIDGTNASIKVYPDGTVRAASRTRWITPEDDNYGFAWWVKEHEEELRSLGEGHHFGEWWGRGIQRKYGMLEKHFSLFNTYRWTHKETPPPCCLVVPVLYEGPFKEEWITAALNILRRDGSKAAPGFTNPEGIVIYHEAGKCYFKKTLENDTVPKGKDE